MPSKTTEFTCVLTNPTETLGNRVYQLRRGRPQQAIAELTGIYTSGNRISDIELGKVLPKNVADVKAIGAALGCTKDQIQHLIHVYHCARTQRDGLECNDCPIFIAFKELTNQ